MNLRITSILMLLISANAGAQQCIQSVTNWYNQRKLSTTLENYLFQFHQTEGTPVIDFLNNNPGDQTIQKNVSTAAAYFDMREIRDTRIRIIETDLPSSTMISSSLAVLPAADINVPIVAVVHKTIYIFSLNFKKVTTDVQIALLVRAFEETTNSFEKIIGNKINACTFSYFLKVCIMVSSCVAGLSIKEILDAKANSFWEKAWIVPAIIAIPTIITAAYDVLKTVPDIVLVNDTLLDLQCIARLKTTLGMQEAIRVQIEMLKASGNATKNGWINKIINTLPRTFSGIRTGKQRIDSLKGFQARIDEAIKANAYATLSLEEKSSSR